jgi:hypothetical protein
MEKKGAGDAKLFQPFFDGRQHAFTLSCQAHESTRSGAIIGLGTIDEFDDAVATTSRLLRKRAIRGLDAFRKASDRKKYKK